MFVGAIVIIVAAIVVLGLVIDWTFNGPPATLAL